jgi:hypothetical protein
MKMHIRDAEEIIGEDMGVLFIPGIPASKKVYGAYVRITDCVRVVMELQPSCLRMIQPICLRMTDKQGVLDAFHLAVVRDDPLDGVVRLMLEHDPTLATSTDNNCLQIHNAGSFATARELVQVYPECAMEKDPEGNLPIHFICTFGNRHVDLLTERHSNVIDAYPQGLITPDSFGQELPIQIYLQRAFALRRDGQKYMGNEGVTFPKVLWDQTYVYAAGRRKDVVSVTRVHQDLNATNLPFSPVSFTPQGPRCAV